MHFGERKLFNPIQSNSIQFNSIYLKLARLLFLSLYILPTYLTYLPYLPIYLPIYLPYLTYLPHLTSPSHTYLLTDLSTLPTHLPTLSTSPSDTIPATQPAQPNYLTYLPNQPAPHSSLSTPYVLELQLQQLQQEQQ